MKIQLCSFNLVLSALHISWLGIDPLLSLVSMSIQSEEKVSAALQEQGVETKSFWGSTLFHIDDLPFKLQDMPSNYGGFRKKVQNVTVRDTILTPHQLKGPPAGGKVKPGNIPSLQELGLNPAALRQVVSLTIYHLYDASWSPKFNVHVRHSLGSCVV